MKLFDLIGVGFGPSNLALAVAIHEETEKLGFAKLDRLFLEAKRQFAWHPGMLLKNMSIQVSFLKDLATLRNPRSHFTFLNYLKESGRLDEFINLKEFFPTRLELNDYFCWAASHFENQVRYGKKVIDILPISLNKGKAIDGIEVIACDLDSGETESYLTRNLVIATGGRPKVPEGVVVKPDGKTFHSSEFLYRIQSQYHHLERPYRFVVVGCGQSAAEIFYYLATHYPNARVTATLRGLGYKPMDDSSFVNEIFFPKMVNLFSELSDENRVNFLENYRHSNYAVVDPDLIKNIYKLMYDQKLQGRERLEIRPFLHFDRVWEESDLVKAQFTHIMQQDTINIECDGLVLATGYDSSNQHKILDSLSEYLVKTPNGDYHVERNYCLASSPEFIPRIFLQGLCEKTHGLSDTLLSILPIRASEILDALLDNPLADRTQEQQINGERTGTEIKLSV